MPAERSISEEDIYKDLHTTAATWVFYQFIQPSILIFSNLANPYTQLFLLLFCLGDLLYSCLPCTITKHENQIRNSNNNGEIETPKSSEDDENNSEESSSNDTNLVDSSNNHLIKWTAEDLVAIDDSEEKIYEDLCYVTISSSAFPSEVFIEKCFCCVI